MVITNYSLQKKLSEVNRHVNRITSGTSSSTGTSDEGTIFMEKTITKVKDNKLICEDGTEAVLYSPLPGLFWKCLGTTNNDGVIILQKKLTGLFLGDGVDTYCLGVNGDTDEFELRMVSGKSEIRFNSTFLNIVTEHLVKNGLEVID